MYSNVLDLKLSTNLCNVNGISHPLTKLKSRKSPGSDQLSMLVLKECAVKWAPSLSLLNNSFDISQMPLSWKITVISSVYPFFFSFFLFFFFYLFLYIYIWAEVYWEEEILFDKIFLIRNLRAISNDFLTYPSLSSVLAKCCPSLFCFHPLRRVIGYYQLNWQRKLTSVKSFKADVSSVIPSSVLWQGTNAETSQTSKASKR